MPNVAGYGSLGEALLKTQEKGLKGLQQFYASKNEIEREQEKYKRQEEEKERAMIAGALQPILRSYERGEYGYDAEAKIRGEEASRSALNSIDINTTQIEAILNRVWQHTKDPYRPEPSALEKARVKYWERGSGGGKTIERVMAESEMKKEMLNEDKTWAEKRETLERHKTTGQITGELYREYDATIKKGEKEGYESELNELESKVKELEPGKEPTKSGKFATWAFDTKHEEWVIKNKKYQEAKKKLENLIDKKAKQNYQKSTGVGENWKSLIPK